MEHQKAHCVAYNARENGFGSKQRIVMSDNHKDSPSKSHHRTAKQNRQIEQHTTHSFIVVLPKPCHPVKPQIPARQPEAMPMTDRVLSTCIKLYRSAFTSKTSFSSVFICPPGLEGSSPANGSMIVVYCCVVRWCWYILLVLCYMIQYIKNN